MDPVLIRSADDADLEHLAQIWFDGWQDGHAELVPDELRRLRTLDSFRERLQEGLGSVRVAEANAQIAGFIMVKGDELYQFFVTSKARGSNVAPMLMKAALDALRGSGAAIGWLDCVIGNDRAARFYEKSGWHRVGVVTSHLPTPEGVFPLDVWRYEIALEPVVSQGPL